MQEKALTFIVQSCLLYLSSRNYVVCRANILHELLFRRIELQKTLPTTFAYSA